MGSSFKKVGLCVQKKFKIEKYRPFVTQTRKKGHGIFFLKINFPILYNTIFFFICVGLFQLN